LTNATDLAAAAADRETLTETAAVARATTLAAPVMIALALTHGSRSNPIPARFVEVAHVPVCAAIGAFGIKSNTAIAQVKESPGK
jgi:hypothetical protein